MKIIPTHRAFDNSRDNANSSWNRSPSSAHLSENETDASRRIYDEFCDIKASYKGDKLRKNSKIFTMGSCFAREIEGAMTKLGGQVVSVTKEMIEDPVFRDGNGQVRPGYLHRFTPRAMWHEFMMAFDKLPSWDSESSLIFPIKDDFVEDLNYWTVTGGDHTRVGTSRRRRIARDLVRNVQDADVVILTLGFTESWYSLKEKLYVNRISPPLLSRKRGDFELRMLDEVDVLECLREIKALIKEVGQPHVHIIITVSPVPLQKTFSDNDIIIANQDSKSTLRSAAAKFTNLNEDVSYFPSYEIVTYSKPDLAWRPDRVHVQPKMVSHIVGKFIETCFEDNAFQL